jgi:hypothetical protein
MAQSAFLQSFLKENPPKNIRMVVARGFAPIPPEEMLLLLVRLHSDPDQEIVEKAKETLAGWSEEDLLKQIKSRDCEPMVLHHIATRSSSSTLTEAVILNPATRGETIEEVAKTVPPQLLEAILYNRVRLLEFPGILRGIKSNPVVTPQIKSLVEQIESEFFGGKKREYAVAETKEEEEEEISSDEVELEFELPPEELSLEGLPLDPEEREAEILKRIGKMTVQQKIQFARLGPREGRAILIRDTNKEIARSVLKSPKLTESEVETYTAMRNVSDDVLREIGNNKTWTKSYTVALNLVRNPKTPPIISQRMLFRLRGKDLALIVRDRGISAAVRRNAQRTLSRRSSNQEKR